IKVAVEGLRTATDFIEQRLRMAGYGVDPRFAFDFNAAVLPSGAKANYSIVYGQGVPTTITDDLAFRYRDPAWLRRGNYASGIQLQTGTTFGMNFLAGQRFIVSCQGGKDYLVVKATGAVSKDASSAAGFTVDTALSSVAASASCLSKTGDSLPYVLLLHEMRIRIVDMGGRPFLVAFQGLDSVDPTNAIPLAADVESFQVAYVMNRPSPSSPNAGVAAVDSSSSVPNWVLGDAGSASADRFPDAAAQAPLYSTPYDDATRYNRHPANIRAVRVSLSVRSTSPESSKRRAFGRVDLEDSGESAIADGYYRTNMTTTVRVPNLLSRSAFNPPVGGDDPAGNVWGG
ncbi:MAG: PilW family protein, partial [Archangium sp.]